jgi:MATE family multidrug resistance protein
MFMSVADNVMVGRVGTVPLAASALSNSLFFLIMVLGLGISMAITPLVAQAYGSGDKKKCGTIFRQGLLINGVTSLILFALTVLVADCLKDMHQPADVLGPATVYMKILGFSIFPVMVFQSYKQFAEGLSVIKSATVIALMANIVNVMVNWVFIFGHLGMPPMGLNGAGIGTLLSRIFMAVGMMIVVRRSEFLKSFDPSLHDFNIDWAMIKKLLNVGIPIGSQYIFEVSSFSGASIVIGWIGTRELAAHQIALNLASLSYMVSLGISAAATVRVGTAFGRKKYQEARMAGFSAVALCAMFMGLFAVIFISMRNLLPGYYISDPEVIGIASHILVIVAVFQIFDGSQAVGVGMLRGLMDMKIPTVMTFAAYWIIGIPAGYVLGITLHMGVTGVWWGLFFGLSSSAVMMLVRFYRISQVREL